MARWNAEIRGADTAFRGKPICARCDRPTFGPGLCSDCHTRFRQGLSDALFTLGVMVAVPCIAGMLFLLLFRTAPVNSQKTSGDAVIILGRAMTGGVGEIFWNLAYSALTAATLSIASFLLLDLPRVLRREPRPDVDWHDAIAALRDIRLLFEKRVTPAGPRPGEPDTADPLDYQTAMQQLHSMLGIEGEIPPEPPSSEDSKDSESSPSQAADTSAFDEGNAPGPAVRDVETIESLIGPASHDGARADTTMDLPPSTDAPQDAGGPADGDQAPPPPGDDQPEPDKQDTDHSSPDTSPQTEPSDAEPPSQETPTPVEAVREVQEVLTVETHGTDPELAGSSPTQVTDEPEKDVAGHSACSESSETSGDDEPEQPVEPSLPESGEETREQTPPPVDSNTAGPEENEETEVEPATDQDEPGAEEETAGQVNGQPDSEPTAPPIEVKDSPFAQRHRLQEPLFETAPPPAVTGLGKAKSAAPVPTPAVDELLDESVAFLFDRPELPGVLQVRTSEWDQLPDQQPDTTGHESVEETGESMRSACESPDDAGDDPTPGDDRDNPAGDESEPTDSALALPPQPVEAEWVDEEDISFPEREADEILDVEPEQSEEQPRPGLDQTPMDAGNADQATIDALIGEDEESKTIDALLGKDEETSAIDEMLTELQDRSDTQPEQLPESGQAEAGLGAPSIEEQTSHMPGSPEDKQEDAGKPTEPEPASAPSDGELTDSSPSDADAVSSTDEPEVPVAGQAEPDKHDRPETAGILLRGPKGSAGIETALTDADGQVACPGCGRRKPSPGPGRYSCSSCKTEFVIPRILARCPGCGRERPSPGSGTYQCSQCRTNFRIPPMISCPGCGRSKPSPGTGRLKCSACGTVFEVINEAGAVR